MTCLELEADIVDLARRADIGADAAERLRQHLEQCESCRARLVRQRQLTAVLKAMAAAEPRSTGTSAIEAELRAAFDAYRTAATRRPPAPRSALAGPLVRAWLAAAALLVLAVAAWQTAARWPSSDETAAGLKPDAVPTARNWEARPAPVADERVLQFVALPTAVGLPALESGRIVRVELPAAELPAYGFVLEPQPTGGAVEADVLVGQDGQPRAIRFVTVATDSRSPQ